MSTFNQRFTLFLATGGGSGYSPVTPGTAGTAVAVAIFFILSPLSISLYVLTVIAFVFLAIWSADRVAHIYKTDSLKKNDPSCIVIDEIAGYLVAMISFPPRWLYIIAGFILFRIMDIIKPYPANIIDKRTRGGVGIVFDDIIAGIYANIILQAIRLFF